MFTDRLNIVIYCILIDINFNHFVLMTSLRIESGPDYLRRLCRQEEGIEPVHILTASEVNSYLVEEKEVNTWMTGVKDYLLQVNGQLITEKNLVFFIETQVFLTNTNPKRAISVMVRILLINY